MTHEFGSGHDLLEVFSRHLPGWTKEKPRKILVITAGVPIEIRTQYLPNTWPEHYHYTNLLGLKEDRVVGACHYVDPECERWKM
jgi:hypothetical protein